MARVQQRLALTRSYQLLDDSDTVFAWQALAGIRAPLSDHLDVSLKYRFFNADNVKLVDVTNRTFDGRFRSHSILGGITYNFGSPTPPPPPPPPPAPEPTPAPPPPPVEAPVCPTPTRKISASCMYLPMRCTELWLRKIQLFLKPIAMNPIVPIRHPKQH